VNFSFICFHRWRIYSQRRGYAWIIEAFEARKELLKQDMRDAHTNISISFDLWSSPSYLSILGIVGHFIDKNGQRRSAVLALREVDGEHSGENMADVLLKTFEDYEISQ
jgi:hypothetical protein